MGFKGFRDWGFVPYISESLLGAGFNVVTFNFSHNGIGNDPLEFTELEKFSENTFSLEVSELNCVLDYLASRYQYGTGNKPLGVLGHSRGGGIALLAGTKRAEVSGVCTWASVSTFERYTSAAIAEWKEKGYHEVKNARTGQVFRMGRNILHDLENNGQGTLNIIRAVENASKPLMFIHGEEDMAVSVDDAMQLANANKNAVLHLVSGTGHTFDARHPFDGSNEKLEEVLVKTIEFFDKNLN